MPMPVGVPGERRKRLAQKPGCVSASVRTLLVHAHHLRGEGQAVARLIQRQHIAADKLGLILARLNEMRLYGITLVAAAVFAGQNAAVIINNAVFFPDGWIPDCVKRPFDCLLG